MHWSRIARDFDRTEPKEGEVWRVYENGAEVDIVVDRCDYGVLCGKGCMNGKVCKFDISNWNTHKLYDSVYDMIASHNDRYKNTDCIGRP